MTKGTAERSVLHDMLLGWYREAHRDLPWRGAFDPYLVLVAEFMLQQTQVSRVEPIFVRFARLFPTVGKLADAPVAEVIRTWSGMGYNRRAVNLHRTAVLIRSDHGGIVPSDEETLRGFPGVGRYTAAAVACFGFGQRVAVLDTNVQRVLGRVNAGPMPMSASEGWCLAEESLPRDESAAADWNQALMDLGATVCIARTPRCGGCPVRTICVSADTYEAAGRDREPMVVAERPKIPAYLGSSRYYRGRIVEALRTAEGSISIEELARFVFTGSDGETSGQMDERIARLVDSLDKEGLVHSDDGSVSLP